MLSNNTLVIEGESDAVLFARNDLVQDVKVTIISHPYLDDMLDKIRTKHIPWEVGTSKFSSYPLSDLLCRSISRWV